MNRNHLPLQSDSRALACCARGSRRVAPLLSLVAYAVLAGCAGSDEDDASGPPNFAGTVAGSGNTAAGGNAGSTPTGMSPVSSTPPPTSSAGGSGVPVGAGGSESLPPVNGGVAGASNAGAGTGSAGSAAVDPNGAAGSSMNGSGGSNSTAGAGGSTNPPQPPTPPTEPDIDCPAGATFCSGFESGAFPADTRFHSVGPGLPNPFLFDGAEVFAGSQALVIPATNSGGFFYRALAVPVPGQDFWVRLYLHSSTPFGDNSHDSLFGASSGGLAADVNGEALVELSEQFNEILLNTDDALFNPPTNGTLPANTWLCMEAHYNGASGDVQIFADGALLIDAAGYRPLSYQSFRIGYMRYNDDRTVRYDDVVVAPSRVGCD